MIRPSAIASSTTTIVDSIGNDSFSSSTDSKKCSMKKRRNKASNKKKQKYVSFCGYVKCKISLPLVDYTDEEYDACWYGPCEYRMMKQEIAQTVAWMEHEQQEKDESVASVVPFTLEFCSRGIEYRTREGRRQKLLRRNTATVAVLELQDMQSMEGTLNPLEIATVYREKSQDSALAAFLFAALDERDVHHFEKQKQQGSQGQGEDNSVDPSDDTAIPNPHSHQTIASLFDLSPKTFSEHKRLEWERRFMANISSLPSVSLSLMSSSSSHREEVNRPSCPLPSAA